MLAGTRGIISSVVAMVGSYLGSNLKILRGCKFNWNHFSSRIFNTLHAIIFDFRQETPRFLKIIMSKLRN